MMVPGFWRAYIRSAGQTYLAAWRDIARANRGWAPGNYVSWQPSANIATPVGKFYAHILQALKVTRGCIIHFKACRKPWKIKP